MSTRGMGKWCLAGTLMLTVGVSMGGSEKGTGTGSALTRAEAKALVDFHNEKRREVKVPDVQWSNEVARFAQEWADHIADTGKVEHRPRQGEFKQKYGENLAWGSGNFSVRQAAAVWYKEKKAYDSGKQDLSKDLAEIGHYTQMVWKDSRRIGAGKAVIKTGDLKGWTVVVCNYDPPGNVIGEKPF